MNFMSTYRRGYLWPRYIGKLESCRVIRPLREHKGRPDSLPPIEVCVKKEVLPPPPPPPEAPAEEAPPPIIEYPHEDLMYQVYPHMKNINKMTPPTGADPIDLSDYRSTYQSSYCEVPMTEAEYNRLRYVRMRVPAGRESLGPLCSGSTPVQTGPCRPEKPPAPDYRRPLYKWKKCPERSLARDEDSDLANRDWIHRHGGMGPGRMVKNF